MDSDNQTQLPTNDENVTAVSKTSRILVGSVTVFLLGIIVVGLLWLFSASSAAPVGFGWYVFSFTAGLSMIVLPCTLPLAFVIIPLVMGKSYKKGLAIALSFSIGIAITLSMYGILAAVLGKAVFAFSDTGGEIIKNIFYTLAGIFAIVFAMGELGFFKIKMPSYGGSVPGFILKRNDLFRPLLMGLFLGNIGVGCPHPATPIILGQIGIVGDVFYGWLLFFVHAIGRVVPLLVLAMFGIIGINATKSLIKHKDSISRATGWGMIFVGAFLLTLGFFSHGWWINSGQHSVFEEIVQEERFTGFLKQRLDSSVEHRHGIATGTGFFGVPLWLGNWVLVLLMMGPIWFSWFRDRKRVRALREEERGPPKQLLKLKFWFFVTLTLLLSLVFIRVLPHWFLQHKALEHEGKGSQQTEELIEHEHEEGISPHDH